MNNKLKENLLFFIKDEQIKKIKREDKIKANIEEVYNIFDYTNEVKKKTKEIEVKHLGNLIYGYEYILRRYAKYPSQINTSIEHGMRTNNTFGYSETFGTTLPGILTFGEYRYSLLENRGNKFIFEIGPYIHYAKSKYTKFEIDAIKQILGKTLLIFPGHSIETILNKTDSNNFIDKVKEIKEKYHFDSVLACCYFMDILRGKHLALEKEGFHIVTAGNKWNFDFMDNLKTIINICDAAAVEGMGTNIGYILYCKKPLIYIDAEIEKVLISHSEYSIQDTERYKKGIENQRKEREVLKKLFGEYYAIITKEQYDWCNYYWGFDKIKTRKEMNEIFKFLDDKRWKKEKGRYNIATDMLKDENLNESMKRAIKGLKDSRKINQYFINRIGEINEKN